MIGKKQLILFLAIAILLITVGVIILVVNCLKKDEPVSTPPSGTLITYIDSSENWMNSRNWAYPGAVGSRVTAQTSKLR